MKNTFIIIVVILGGELFSGCSRSPKHIGTISAVHVENIHGGARISYQLPPGDSASYVQARYKGVDGDVHRKRISFYHRKFFIRNLADTSARTVHLRATGRGGSISKPVDVAIHPKRAVAKMVAEHMSLQPATGGLRLAFVNPTDTDLELTVLRKDTAGHIHRWQHFYPDLAHAGYLLAGWPSGTQSIGGYLRDQGNVRSDTMFVKLDTLSWKGINQLKNNIFPIRFARYDGHRWGTPAEWKVNKAVRNQGGYGGDDRLDQPSPKGGYFSMEAWDHYSQNNSLLNGKIWQTLRLPAGRYSLDGYFHRGTQFSIHFKHGSNAWLVVARGRNLPDYERLGTALGHAPLKDPHVEFTLAKPMTVTVGFVGYYVQRFNNFRCPAVALRRVNKSDISYQPTSNILSFKKGFNKFVIDFDDYPSLGNGKHFQLKNSSPNRDFSYWLSGFAPKQESHMARNPRAP